jgi:hypothetical protein
LKNNRLVALLIALVLLVQTLSGMAVVHAVSPASITIGNVQGKTGETIKLIVSIKNNTGFAGFTLRASYDKNALTLTKIEQGEVLNAMDASGLISNVSVGVANWASTTNTTGNGSLMAMTFSVNHDAAAGDYSVTLTAEDFFSVDDNGRFLDYAVSITPGTISVSGAAHVHQYTGTTVRATCTEGGYTTYTCSCGESYVADQTPALGHEWKGTSCTRCGEKRHNPFVDVPEGSWFINPVLWAVDKGVTSGVDATHFGPDQACTRAQVVTFLYAAQGKPEPKTNGNPFVDVKESDWYYKPVMWAIENGITSGIDATHFGPGAECTREQVVTFLWGAEGKPTASTAVSFTDVPAGAWFYSPVAWAVENGVTSGMGNGTFGVGVTCTRAQVVTFLYAARK